MLKNPIEQDVTLWFVGCGLYLFFYVLLNPKLQTRSIDLPDG